MAKRIIVKIGSQVLCDPAGDLNRDVLSKLVSQLGSLQKDGWQVLLVSSGAVAAGSGLASEQLKRLSDPVTRKQVMAATGQVRLMETYRELFELEGLNIAQVLATKSDFQTRHHYLNMRGCIEALLATGIVPVVNENDVVSVTELMFTDNDELAGLLAGMVNADLLCLLSTVHRSRHCRRHRSRNHWKNSQQSQNWHPFPGQRQCLIGQKMAGQRR